MTKSDELVIGLEHVPFTDSPLTITDFVRYQGASGDMNPIHHDSEFARAAGYPEPFAVGMMPAGVLGTYLTDWLGASNLRLFSIQFREQAWPGDVLTYKARVISVEHEELCDRVELASEILRQTGGTFANGRAVFEFPRERAS